MSFLKMMTVVWTYIVGRQRNYAWDGSKEGKFLLWVSWDEVCIPKIKGCLGVLDLHMVNLDVRCKWRKHIIFGDGGFFKGPSCF